MHRLATSFVLGYHGCSEAVANGLLSGQPFKPSQNDYDWLGPGIYFWQSNPSRALRFAEEKRLRDREDWTAAVVGAVIDLGLCLDLTTETGIDEVRQAHLTLIALQAEGETQLPQNSGGKDLLLRKLDCAVIRVLHGIRENRGETAIDTVVGIFEEGEALYENSGFRTKTHVQVCVRHQSSIKGVFRVAPSEYHPSA